MNTEQVVVVTERQCTVCKQVKPLEDFYEHVNGKYGRTARCKQCLREIVKNHYDPEYQREYEKRTGKNKAWRRAHREHTAEYNRNRYHNSLKHRREMLARSMAYTAVAKGIIVKQDKCCQCGGVAEQMHHPSYMDPLNVWWLCKPCHRKIHRAIRLAKRSKQAA